MTSPARIPRAMTIIPQVGGLGEFQNDLKAATNAVRQFRNEINKISRTINTRAGGARTGASQFTAFGSAIGGADRIMRNAIGTVDRFGQGIVNVGSLIERTGSVARRLAFDLERIGRGMLIFVTLPLVAAGTAIVKWGSDFERELKKVETLVGVNEEVVQRWGARILDIAPQLGALPVDLAKGLFFAASGFGSLAAEGDQAFKVLVASAKGAALGMGEIEDVARAATVIMNIYGNEVGTATRAVELLMLTTREGNFEIDKLSDSLSGVVGLAKEVGVTMEDLSAAIATLTRGGSSPSEAVTILRSSLLNLVAPSKENKEILTALGYTFDSLTKKIGEDGLLGVLIDLRQRMGSEFFLDFFNIRAVRGAVSITGELADDYAKIMDIMERSGTHTWNAITKTSTRSSKIIMSSTINDMNATSDAIAGLDESFSKLFDTVSFKFLALRAAIQSAGTSIFQAYEEDIKNFLDRMLEVVENIRSFITENQETTKLVVKIAAGFALLGPVIIIFSRLLSAASFFFTLLGRGVIVVGSLVKAFAAVLLVGYNLATFLAGSLIKGIALLVIGVQKLVIGLGTLVARFLALIATQIASGLAAISSYFFTMAGAAFNVGLHVGNAAKTMVFFTASRILSGLSAIVTGFVGIAGAALSIVGAVGSVALAVGTVTIAILALVGIAQQIGNAIGNAFDSIRKKVESFLGDLSDKTGASDFKSWGTDLMKAFSDGLIDGFIYVVETLNALGEVLAQWLAPGSPPKIAPNLDKWGTEAMQVYLEGWRAADFSVLTDIGKTIESYLTAITTEIGEETDRKPIINAVLGSRQEIAKAINQVKEFGKVTEDTFQRIFAAIGMTTPELEGYIRAMLDVAAASDKVAAAQLKVNEINERYENSLGPIKRRLQEISNIRQNLDDVARIKQLQDVLENKFAPEEVKYRASLELEEIQLRSDQSNLELNRDQELSVAERHLAAAEQQLDDSKAQLEYWQGLIGLQESAYELLQDIAKSNKEIAEKLKKGESLEFDPEDIEIKGLNQFGGGDGEGLFEKILGPYDEKLEDLKEALNGLKDTWFDVFKAIRERVLGWWKDMDLEGKWKSFKEWYDTYLAPIVKALKETGANTWESLKELGRTIDQYFGDDSAWSDFVAKAEELLYEILEGLPAQILNLSAAINGPDGLIQAVKDAIPVLADFLDSRKDKSLIFDLFNVPEDQRFEPGGQLGGFFNFWKELNEEATTDIPLQQNWQNTLDFFTEGFENMRRVLSEEILLINSSMETVGVTAEEEADILDNAALQMLGALSGAGAGANLLEGRFYLTRVAVGFLRDKLGEFVNYLSTSLITWLNTTATKFDTMRTESLLPFKTIIEEIHGWWVDLVDYGNLHIIPFLTNLKDKILEGLENAFNPFLKWLQDSNTESGIFQTFLEGIKKWMEELVLAMDPLNKAWETFVGWLNAAVEKLKALPQWMIDFFKKYGFFPDNVPEEPKEEEEEGGGGGGGPPGVVEDFSILPGSVGNQVSDLVGNFFSGVGPAVSPTGTPLVLGQTGSQISVGGVQIMFGNVNINNGMDLAQFEATVANVVAQSIENF